MSDGSTRDDEADDLPRARSFSRRSEAGPVEPAPYQLYVGLRGTAVLQTVRHGDLMIRPRDLVWVGNDVSSLSGSAFDVVVGDFTHGQQARGAGPTLRHVRSATANLLHRSLAFELAAPREGQTRAVLALLDALLTHVAHPTQRGSVDGHVLRALAAMSEAPARRWTVASLARVAGLSRAPFARRFQQATGQSPLRWLAAHRMQIATDRLTESDDALAQVAAFIGYESEFAFAKAFRRHFGEAPGTFRRRMTTTMSRAA